MGMLVGQSKGNLLSGVRCDGLILASETPKPPCSPGGEGTPTAFPACQLTVLGGDGGFAQWCFASAAAFCTRRFAIVHVGAGAGKARGIDAVQRPCACSV